MNEKIAAEELDALQGELAEALSPRYDVKECLGHGGAGAAFLVHEAATEARRVAKIMRLRARDLAKLRSEFEDEPRKLARLRHPNLVTVYEHSGSDSVPYYIMEFVDGNELDKAMASLAEEHPAGRWVARLRRVFLQLADVLMYLHGQKPSLFHLDVKPENVRLFLDHRGKPTPVLLDFGISRYREGKPDRMTEAIGTFPMWPQKYADYIKKLTDKNRTVFQIERSRLDSQLDLHLLGRTIDMVLDACVKHDPQPLSAWSDRRSHEYRFLRGLCQDLNLDEEDRSRVSSAADLRTTLRRLELVASRTRWYFDQGAVRVPGQQISLLGRQGRALTDWHRFQRLRGVGQLGLASLVYPGAVHSRLEHSFGVFEYAIRYLDQLAGVTGDHRFRAEVSDADLVATSVLALMHDVGHYPFAHQFRLRGEYPKHEERTLEVLRSDEFKDRLVSGFGEFGTAVWDSLCAQAAFLVASESHSKRDPDMPEIPPHFHVLRAVISSSIDVDKLDYLARDAVHAGVPYGRVVDPIRLISSLRIWWSSDGVPMLTVSDKGRVCAEAMVFSRYLMFSEVYWNHAVRAYSAMLSVALWSLELEKPDEVKSHMWDTDALFIHWVLGQDHVSWLRPLFASRTPYRRALVHQRQTATGEVRDEDKNLFEFLEEAASDWEGERAEALRELVASAIGATGIQAHDIVVDVPDAATRIAGVNVFGEGQEKPSPPGPVYNGIAQNFDGYARKARIFVHPRFMQGRSVSLTSKELRATLIKEFHLR